MNLSETAFLWPDESGDGFSIRWFTPSVEVALCGHATLASAHIL
ncbi:MAG: PhzF family phenazine biosynthesis protein [Tepidiformaceae bacterium]